jgi:uncharacterized protein (DUF433 family)
MDALPPIKERPIYSVAQAARFLRVPTSTVRSWTSGARPLVALTDGRLSFMSLVELQVVRAMRVKHRFSLVAIRSAAESAKRLIGGDHPLAAKQFETDGVSIFLRELHLLTDMGHHMQLAMKEILIKHLRAIVRDESGAPVRLLVDDAHRVQIDPNIGYGYPTIVGNGGAVSVIQERHRAGEPIEELADDYGVTEEEIRAALAYANAA